MIDKEDLRNALLTIATEAADAGSTLSVFRNPEDGIVVVVALGDDAPALIKVIEMLRRKDGREIVKGRSINVQDN
jgi:hypothetical protein